jgi:hypothetical protein
MKAINFCLLVLVILVFSACQKESNDPYGQFVGKWNIALKSTATIYFDLSHETRIIRENHFYEYDFQFNRQLITKDSTGIERVGAWGYLPDKNEILLLSNYTETLPNGTIRPYMSSGSYPIISVEANTQHWQILYSSSGNISDSTPGNTYSVSAVTDYYLTRQ